MWKLQQKENNNEEKWREKERQTNSKKKTNQFIHEVKWERTTKITLINGRILWITIYERKRRETKPKLQLK